VGETVLLGEAAHVLHGSSGNTFDRQDYLSGTLGHTTNNTASADFSGLVDALGDDSLDSSDESSSGAALSTILAQTSLGTSGTANISEILCASSSLGQSLYQTNSSPQFALGRFASLSSDDLSYNLSGTLGLSLDMADYLSGALLSASDELSGTLAVKSVRLSGNAFVDLGQALSL